MAQDNARNMMAEQIPKEQREVEANRKAMQDLREALGLEGLPRRIEGYDISNITGKEAVASMVVLTDGKPDKSQYRKFRMKTDGKPNDFAMMQEVLWRRFRKGLAERDEAKKTGKGGKFAVFPDLVMVDGGKGQVSSAKDVLDELNLPIPLVGLAKRNEELFLPGQTDPVRIPKDSALFLVMRLRARLTVCDRLPPRYSRKKTVPFELGYSWRRSYFKAAGLFKAFGYDVDL